MNVVESPYMIKSVICNIDIIQNKVYYQNQFLDAYRSVISINNIVVTGIIISDAFIKFIISSLTIDHLEIVNVSNPNHVRFPMIAGSAESILYANDIYHLHDDSLLLVLVDVSGKISNLIINSSTSITDTINIDYWKNLEIHNLTLNNVSTNYDYIMIAKYSTNIEITRLNFMNID